jgi:uncharacterized membrane protein YkoI
MRVTALALALAATMAVPSAFADKGKNSHEENHEKLDDARRQGALMPIELLLKRLNEKLKGEILEIELDDKDGRLYYEIYYLDSEGRRIEIEVDAATGEILNDKAED